MSDGGTQGQADKKGVGRAVGYAFLQRYLAFAVQLITSIILARLLTPEETGVFSLAAAAVALGGAIREFGISDYLITSRDVDKVRLRSAYTVTVLLAWFIAAVLLAASGGVASFYGDARVQDVMMVLCLNFALVPFGSTASALLTRDLQFAPVFWTQSAGVVVGAAVSIACAMYGLSSTSPAWGSIAGMLTTTALLAIRAPATVFMPPAFGALKEVLRFGGTLTASKLLESLSTRCDDFIISASLGFHASGLLSKATSLNAGFYNVFASAIVSVATPVIASARRAGGLRPEDYSRVLCIMSAPQWLFFGLMFVLAKPVILLLFGPAWMGAVTVLKIGAVQGALYAPFMLCSPLLVAFREVKALLWINLVYLVSVAAALSLGALHSLEMAAALLIGAHCIRFFNWSLAVRNAAGIEIVPVLRSMLPSVWVAAAAVGIAYGLALLLESMNAGSFATVAVVAVAASIVFLGMVVATRHPLFLEVQSRYPAFTRRKSQ